MGKNFDARRLERLQLQRDVARGALLAARDQRDRYRRTYLEILALHRSQFEIPVPASEALPPRGPILGNGLSLEQSVNYVSNRVQKERFPKEFEKSEGAVADAKEALDRAQAGLEELRLQDSYASALLAGANAHIADRQYKPSTDTRSPIWEWAAELPMSFGLGNAKDCVAEQRAAILRLNLKRDETRNRHVAKEQARGRFEDELARLSAASPAAASIGYMVRPDGNAHNLLSHQVAQIAHGGVAVPGEMDVSLNAKLLLSVLGDAIRKRFVEELDEFYKKYGPGISDADRADELAAIDREILQRGILEEHAIRVAESMGLTIRRRLDADMDIVLGPLLESPAAGIGDARAGSNIRNV